MALCEAGTEIWVGVLDLEQTYKRDRHWIPPPQSPSPCSICQQSGEKPGQKKKKNAKKDLLHSNVAVQKLEFIINSQKKKKKTRENKTA